MKHIHPLARLVAGALLSGGVALAGFGLAAATAQAAPSVDGATVGPSVGTQPASPGARVGFDPQPDPPGTRVGFDPQPEPPTRIQLPGTTKSFNPQPEIPIKPGGVVHH